MINVGIIYSREYWGLCGGWFAGDGVGEFLLAKLNVLFDAVAETAAPSCDVASNSMLTSVKGEAFQSVVFHLAAYYLNQIAIDWLHETVVVTTVRHRH